MILLALTCLMMVGCDEINNEIKEVENVRQTANSVIREWHNEIIIIDSCEYISEETRGLVEHKSNCRFCEERRHKEFEELIRQLKEK